MGEPGAGVTSAGSDDAEALPEPSQWLPNARRMRSKEGAGRSFWVMGGCHTPP